MNEKLLKKFLKVYGLKLLDLEQKLNEISQILESHKINIADLKIQMEVMKNEISQIRTEFEKTQNKPEKTPLLTRLFRKIFKNTKE